MRWHVLFFLLLLIVLEMTYNVSSGMSNPTIPYHHSALTFIAALGVIERLK